MFNRAITAICNGQNWVSIGVVGNWGGEGWGTWVITGWAYKGSGGDMCGGGGGGRPKVGVVGAGGKGKGIRLLPVGGQVM